mmetsp:Transcript_39386/g.123294  ORF Transcript_39386/g.123294 Transcript_39386/m.123294 type:complete len:194 (-) Transcript_39386:98-679(-)
MAAEGGPDLATLGTRGLQQLTGNEYAGLAQLDREGVLLETEISEILHARERMHHQIEHLLRSNDELREFLAAEHAGDPDLEAAIEENEGVVAKKLEKIAEIEDAVERSLPHVAPRPLRFTRPLPNGLIYRGSAGDGGAAEAKGEVDAAAPDASAAAAAGGSSSGPMFGGMGDFDDAPEPEAKTAETDDGGVYL